MDTRVRSIFVTLGGRDRETDVYASRGAECDAYCPRRMGKTGLIQDFIRAHRLPAPSSVKTALNALVDKQLVTRTPKGCCVSDIFFALWLRSL